MNAEQALVTVTALHLGFQLTVSVVVYPALIAVTDREWPVAHAAHSRRIVTIVAPLYVALAGVGAWILVEGPVGPGTGVALAGTAVAVATTAAVAAPVHGRLGQGRTPARVRRLLAADRVRTLAALVALFGAVT